VNGVGQGVVGNGGGGPDNRIFLTIWDGGGIDTYDFSAYATKVTVSLVPGSFSIASVGYRADLGDGHDARGNVFNALLHEDDPRSLIENATGGSGSDRLKGNEAKNVLRGNAGNDALTGLEGNDTLHGGAGRDSFLFTTALDRWKNVDRIADFSVPNDTIHLDNAIFLGLGGSGKLAGGRFHKGSAAHDSSDRIIYDKASGTLFYDPDGTGAGSAVKFAQLKPGLGLTAADFLIV
jgi:serralysin